MIQNNPAFKKIHQIVKQINEKFTFQKIIINKSSRANEEKTNVLLKRIAKLEYIVAKFQMKAKARAKKRKERKEKRTLSFKNRQLNQGASMLPPAQQNGNHRQNPTVGSNNRTIPISNRNF